MLNDKFYDNYTFDEWSAEQDANSLEFKIIEQVHDIFPSWNIEDIKEYIPGFLMSYLKIMQDIYDDNKDSSIDDIKNKILEYISEGKKYIMNKTEEDLINIETENFEVKSLEKFYNGGTYEDWANKQNTDSLEFKAIAFCHMYLPGMNLEDIKKKIYSDYIKTSGKRKIHIEFFGEEPENPDDWNEFLDELGNIVLSDTSPFKSEDRRGHGIVLGTRLGERRYAFRTEYEFSRDLHELIDYGIDRKRYPTQSDFLREWIGKSVKIYSLIHKNDPILNKYLEKEISYESEAEINTICDKIDNFKFSLVEGLRIFEMNIDEAIKNNYDKNSLLQIRDAIIRLLMRGPGHKGRMRNVYEDKMKNLIKNDGNIHRCLRRLEELNLISKEFMNNIIETGVIPSLDKGWFQ